LSNVSTKLMETRLINYELPEGWSTTVLDKVGHWSTGGTPSRKVTKNFGGGIPWVKSGDLNDGRVKITEETLTREGIESSAAKIVPAGAVIIALYGATIGKLGMLEIDAATNQACANCEVIGEAIDRWFLFYYLLYQRRALIEAGQGGAQPNLNNRIIRNWPLLLPPLAEQKRIVAKVGELLERVNATEERLAKVSMILKRFREAVLTAACSGRLTADWRSTQKELEPADHLVEHIRRKYREQYEAECSKAKQEGKKLPKKPEILQLRKVETAGLPEIPDEWMWIYLPALDHLSRGKSKHRPRNAPHLYGGPYPFIQTGDIAQSRGLITLHQQTYSEAGLAQSHLWPSGTICITIAANIASSAILTYPACFPDSVVGLISDESLCLKEYAEYFIRTARANLEQFAPATAQKNINVAILNDVAVALPPITEQIEIVRRVEAMFKLADAVEKRVAAATVRAEKLTQAILAKAFRGELVPTEAELARRERRSYESASDLLARIKSERELKSRPVGVNRIRGPRKRMK
jgi:type I restriction enzyme S subunit